MRSIVWFVFLGALLLSLVLAGCSTPPPKEPARSGDNIPVFEKVAVVPFKNMSKVYGEMTAVRCGLCGSVFTTGPVGPEGTQVLTTLAAAYLSEHYPQLTVISGNQARGERASMLAEGSRVPASEKAMVLELGRRLAADAVLTGHLFRYVDRVGTGFGIERPASVGFDIDLVEVSSGRLLWTARFDETQQSLLENVFAAKLFFNRGGRWLTAEELASAGMFEAMADFPVQP